MTVIYSNWGDVDTSYLPLVWRNIPNVRVIEITNELMDSDVDYEEMVNQALREEDDFLIFAGHGTSNGLLAPCHYNWRGIYLIHENNVNLIHARNVVGFTCHAAQFAEAQHLNGFFTSMFVSNINESIDYNILGANNQDISVCEQRFCNRLNDLITNNVPLSEWVAFFQNQVDTNNSTEVYNYNGLRYFNN